MRVLIVSATSFEIAPSLKLLKSAGADIVITGVGCAPAIYHITKAIQKYKPGFIIQAGVAGSFGEAIKLGAVVAVCKDSFGDIGVIEERKWKSIFEMGFIKPNQKPFTNSWLNNPDKKILMRCGLKNATAITVNEITTNKNKIALFKEQGVEVESMEGAALHYVALIEKVPFLQLRSISNRVGERNKTNWDVKGAIHNLNTELERLIKDMM